MNNDHKQQHDSSHFNLNVSKVDKKFADESSSFERDGQKSKKKTSRKNKKPSDRSLHSSRKTKFDSMSEIGEKRKRMKKAKGRLSMKFSPEDLYRGVIMKEVLSSPRSRRPHRCFRNIR